jgi:hypothetical protein
VFTTLRIVVGACAALLVIAGIGVIIFGGLPGPSGLWLVATGAIGLVAVLLERTRYRSEDAELRGQDPGVAGIDDDPLDPRFGPTDERFVDPTTRRAVRVWVDPASGERRYRLDE